MLRNAKVPINRISVRRIDYEYLQYRVGDLDTEFKMNKNVCIIGCGSIGSKIAMSLVQSGIRNVTLIDSEKIESENIARNLCGAFYLRWKKVKAAHVRRQK